MIEGLTMLVCMVAVFAALTLAGWIICKVFDLVFGKDDEERQEDIHRH